MVDPIIKIQLTNRRTPSFKDSFQANISEDEVFDYLDVLLSQEEFKYECKDYLSKIPASMKDKFVNEECREKMLGWCFQIIDSFDYDREIMHFTASYMDRYLQTVYGWEALESRRHFQIVVISCLYLAVKLHGVEVMNPQCMATLSQFPEEEIIETEMKILSSLDWKLHPPTPFAYLPIYFSQIPIDQNSKDVYQLISYQIELSVCYYSYAQIKPSVISYAALANALQFFNEESSFLLKLRQIARISDSEALRVQKMLIRTLSQNLDSQSAIFMSRPLHNSNKQPFCSKDEHDKSPSSPRSIYSCSTKTSHRPDHISLCSKKLS